MDNNITILQWNCQSIRARVNELNIFIGKMEKVPDIIALQETWLKEGNNFSISGYNIVRLDRGRHQGEGVATLLREGISYTSQTIEQNEYESLLVTISSEKGSNITIINAYVPPNANHQTLLSTQEKSFSYTNSIVLGDFNAYSVVFGAETSDNREKLIEKLLDQYGLVALFSGSGTHLTPSGRTTPIDLAMCSPSLSQKALCKVLDENLGSDHYPVLITLNKKSITR